MGRRTTPSSWMAFQPGLRRLLREAYGEEQQTFWGRTKYAYQNDHVFVSQDLAPTVASCEVANRGGLSDHSPTQSHSGGWIRSRCGLSPRCRFRVEAIASRAMRRNGLSRPSRRSRKPLTAATSSEGSNTAPSAFGLDKGPICSGSCQRFGRIARHPGTPASYCEARLARSRAGPRVRTIARGSRAFAYRALR
jgi:hypothetical protein